MNSNTVSSFRFPGQHGVAVEASDRRTTYNSWPGLLVCEELHGTSESVLTEVFESSPDIHRFAQAAAETDDLQSGAALFSLSETRDLLVDQVKGFFNDWLEESLDVFPIPKSADVTMLAKAPN